MHVAAFITAHGFGHAGRASAILDALAARRPDLTVDLFTRVPDAFLRSSLRTPYRRIEVVSDAGMVQLGPFASDMEATTRAVAAWVGGLEKRAAQIADELAHADVVVCDIDALGILAARRAGVPSVLVENFRWDWIYAELDEADAELRALASQLAEVYRRADLHVQVAPACDRVEGAVQVDLPVARAARSSRDRARAALGVDPAERVVLVTLGGIPGEHPSPELLHGRPDLTFLVTGADRSERVENVVRFAYDEPLYLPDVVRASDAVVAKLGYSTLAETWREGRPLLRIPRRQWPEGGVLSAWADAHVPGFSVEEPDFRSGAWSLRLDELLALDAAPARDRAGQDEVAEAILQRVG